MLMYEEKIYEILKMNSLIAVLHRDYLPHDILSDKSIVPCDEKNVQKILRRVKFLRRDKAENDYEHKQIMPYVIIKNKNKQVASYHRKGNELQLHGLRSIGSGGHIEYTDVENLLDLESLKRVAIGELNEEFSDKVEYELIFKGIINEEITRVGKTHLGMVFKTGVYRCDYVKSNEIGEIEWVTLETARGPEFE